MATGTIVLTRGDDYPQALALDRDDGSGDPWDLTGAVLRFVVKRSLADADADALIAHESGDGNLEIDDAAGGTGTHVLPAAETAALDPGVYRYEYELTAADGTVATPERGKLVVRADARRGGA